MTFLTKFEAKNLDKSVRKRFAAFYTKKSVSDFLNNFLLEEVNSLILDPSCGSGTLLSSSIDVIHQMSSNGQNDFQLIGVEIFLEAWKEAVTLEKKKNSLIDIKILYGDIFNLINNIQKFITSYQEMNNENYFQTIILANPPFSKAQNLPLNYKKNICQNLKLPEFKSLSLHSYFLNLIFKLLPNEGKFGLILPITTTYSNRGNVLVKDFFLNVSLNYIIISEVESSFSIDSNFQEMIVIGKKSNLSTNKNLVTIINLKEKLTGKNWKIILELIKNSSLRKTNHFFSHTTHQQLSLINRLGHEGWNFLYAPNRLNNFIENLKENLITAQAEKRISFKRGINAPSDFFFLPNKYFTLEESKERTIALKLKDTYLSKFENKYHKIILPKQSCIKLIRKPEYYKLNSVVRTKENINYCLFLDQNLKIGPEIKKYLEFGEQCGINHRSNMIILGKKWIYSSSNNPNLGKLFLTFKWDPRYRSFLFNYTKEAYIASQAFWIFTIDGSKKFEEEFFLAWMNSTLSMAIIYELADVQRKVWRQLSGTRINNLLIVRFEEIKFLSDNDKITIQNFNNKSFETNLTKELENSIKIMQGKNSELFNDRINIDLLFMKLLFKNEEVKNRLNMLQDFYQDFLEELLKLNR